MTIDPLPDTRVVAVGEWDAVGFDVAGSDPVGAGTGGQCGDEGQAWLARQRDDVFDDRWQQPAAG